MNSLRFYVLLALCLCLVQASTSLAGGRSASLVRGGGIGGGMARMVGATTSLLTSRVRVVSAKNTCGERRGTATDSLGHSNSNSNAHTGSKEDNSRRPHLHSSSHRLNGHSNHRKMLNHKYKHLHHQHFHTQQDHQGSDDKKHHQQKEDSKSDKKHHKEDSNSDKNKKHHKEDSNSDKNKKHQKQNKSGGGGDGDKKQAKVSSSKEKPAAKKQKVSAPSTDSSGSSNKKNNNNNKDQVNGMVGGIEHFGSGLSNKVFGGACPHPKADAQHPNGALEFLTCGISQKDVHSKWRPPHVELKDLKVISSSEAARTDIFKPCAKYKQSFDRVSARTGVPAVLLMSFALQESSCRAHEIGPNGEFGLMQITPDKCGGAPNGDCRDVDYNIGRGAKYFKDQLDGPCNGNVLCAAGTYNGWAPGTMTYMTATNQQWGCRAQNNLDYLNSLFNGFCQGKDGYSDEFVKFGNLKKCG